MIVVMKEMLCNSLGVFHPGDKYEASEEACNALIAHGYAFDPKIKDPDVVPWDGVPEQETAEAEPKRETAAKKTTKKGAKKRGRPRK